MNRLARTGFSPEILAKIDSSEYASYTTPELRDLLEKVEPGSNIARNRITAELQRRGALSVIRSPKPRLRPVPSDPRAERLVSLPDLPDGWHPDDNPDEWTEYDEAWLETCLQLLDDYDGFNPKQHLAARGRTPNAFAFLREESGLTQKELADRLGVGQGTIARWENGTRRPDDERYFAFLEDAAEALCQRVCVSIWRQAGKRDGWWNPELNLTMGDAYERLWPVLFKPGGTIDRWREAGTLPTWTPTDAGCA